MWTPKFSTIFRPVLFCLLEPGSQRPGFWHEHPSLLPRELQVSHSPNLSEFVEEGVILFELFTL